MIRFWNRGATRIFGFAEAEAIGQSLDIIIPERLRARHWEGFRTTMRTGQSCYGADQLLPVPAIRNDGALISGEFTIMPFTEHSEQIDRHRRDHARRHRPVQGTTHAQLPTRQPRAQD